MSTELIRWFHIFGTSRNTRKPKSDVGGATIRKLSPSKSAEIKGVVLYQEDLQTLQNILSEASCTNVLFRTTEFEYDTADEIAASNHQPVNELEITAKNPYITVEVRYWGIRLYRGDSDARTVGVFCTVQSFLNARRSLGRLLLEAPLVVAVAGVASVSSAILLDLSVSTLHPVTGVGVGLAIYLLMASLMFRLRQTLPSVYFRKRDNTTAAWRKHSTTILVAVISSILGGVITAAIIRLLGLK